MNNLIDSIDIIIFFYKNDKITKGCFSFEKFFFSIPACLDELVLNFYSAAIGK